MPAPRIERAAIQPLPIADADINPYHADSMRQRYPDPLTRPVCHRPICPQCHAVIPQNHCHCTWFGRQNSCISWICDTCYQETGDNEDFDDDYDHDEDPGDVGSYSPERIESAVRAGVQVRTKLCQT